MDGTKLALCVSEAAEDRPALTSSGARRVPVYILYFQGWLYLPGIKRD